MDIIWQGSAEGLSEKDVEYNLFNCCLTQLKHYFHLCERNKRVRSEEPNFERLMDDLSDVKHISRTKVNILPSHSYPKSIVPELSVSSLTINRSIAVSESGTLVDW